METKKAIVKSVIFKKSGTNSKTNKPYHIFALEFENGDKGDYFSSENPCKDFEVGKESEYNIEKRINGEYTNYSITKPSAQKSFVGGASAVKNNKQAALQAAAQTHSSGITSPDEVLATATTYLKWLES